MLVTRRSAEHRVSARLSADRTNRRDNDAIISDYDDCPRLTTSTNV
jgi:hypothetical protein